MAHCSNCGVGLAQGEIDMCYVCANATPQEQAKRFQRYLGQTKKPARQPHINALDTLPHTPERKLQIGLTSGKLVTVGRVMLFPEPDIRTFLALKAKAQQEMGGFSTGLGFWGSPEWAIGGAAALGLIESLVSGAKAKQGMKTLSEATNAQASMRSQGLFFGVYLIAAIWQHDPFVWRAIKEDTDDTGIGNIDYIHNGDESIWVEQEGRLVAIRWASVESYTLV